MVVNSVSLHYVGGTSDKVYKAEVTMKDGTYTLTGHWGRRGKSMQSQIKGTFQFHWDAVRAMHSLVSQKTGKGYRITERTAV